MADLTTPIRYKQPGETRTVPFEFVDKLASGDTLTGLPTVVADPGLTVVTSAVAGTLVNVRVSGGTNGAGFNLSCKIGTTQGDLLELDAFIYVLEGITWAWDPRLASDRQVIRALIGDTQEAERKLDDPMIDWCLANETGLFTAAARACEMIAATYARTSALSVAGASVSSESQFEKYRTLAKDYRARGRTFEVPTAGGISVAEKALLEDDADWPRPAFRRGLHEHPGTPGPDDRCR